VKSSVTFPQHPAVIRLKLLSTTLPMDLPKFPNRQKHFDHAVLLNIAVVKNCLLRYPMVQVREVLMVLRGVRALFDLILQIHAFGIEGDVDFDG